MKLFALICLVATFSLASTMSVQNTGITDESLREGDIKIKISTTSKAHGMLNQNQRWNNGIVPYRINMGANSIATIKQAMELITARTGCIRFVERTTEQDYLDISSQDGCWSYVGRIGGRQELSLGNGCVYGNIVVHELMHALGIYHEQNRADRDNFVTIVYNNIPTNAQDQFDKRTSNGQTFNTVYDYNSVMHYGEYDFAINRNQPTIIAKNGNRIGEIDAIMTVSDANGLRDLYQCSANPTTTTTTSTTTTTPSTTRSTTPSTTRSTTPSTTRSTTPSTTSSSTTTQNPDGDFECTLKNNFNFNFYLYKDTGYGAMYVGRIRGGAKKALKGKNGEVYYSVTSSFGYYAPIVLGEGVLANKNNRVAKLSRFRFYRL